MTGFNPIKNTLDSDTSLKRKVSEAVQLVASAMQNGMLDPEEIEALENGGIRPMDKDVGMNELIDELGGLARMVKNAIADGDSLKISDSKELSPMIGNLTKLLTIVSKHKSEAKAIAENDATRLSMIEALKVFSQNCDGTDLENSATLAMAQFRDDLERRLKDVQRRFLED